MVVKTKKCIGLIFGGNSNEHFVSIASANLGTLAVRFPKHKIARSILRYLQFPLAMPSANLSSNLSPVYARDVFEDFKKTSLVLSTLFSG